jgi:hypothetical protein
MREHSCCTCGTTFRGGPAARFCPVCRSERKAAAQKRYRANTCPRHIGETDLCAGCGEKYIVNGGLQKFCEACARKRAAEKSLSYYHQNKEKVAPKKAARRKIDKEVQKELNHKAPAEPIVIERNIQRACSGRFKVACYARDCSFYLGTVPELSEAQKRRDTFLELVESGASKEELEAYRKECIAQGKNQKQASAYTLTKKSHMVTMEEK